MIKNLNLVLLVFLVSTTAFTQNLKFNQPGLFPSVWMAGRELVKSISEGLLNSEKIQEEAKKRTQGYLIVLASKKSHLKTMSERRKRIKGLRRDVAESSREVPSTGSKTSQELETELLDLLALGLSTSLEPSHPTSGLIEAEIEESTQGMVRFPGPKSGSWRVPGTLNAPGVDSPADSPTSSADFVPRTEATTIDPRNLPWSTGPREAQSVGRLEWETGRKDSSMVSYAEAKQYAEAMKAEGYRLPSIWELEALFEQRHVLGRDLDVGQFWSSTSSGFGSHWCLNFMIGDVVKGSTLGLIPTQRRVRLVRSERSILESRASRESHETRGPAKLERAAASSETDLCQRLLTTEEKQDVQNSSNQLSEDASYTASFQLEEIIGYAKRRPYWPSRYRKIFRMILGPQQIAELGEHARYLGPITEATAHVPIPSKKEILKRVINVWMSNPDLALRAALSPADPLSTELTLEYLRTLKSTNCYDPMEFRDYDSGSQMRPELERLLIQLLGGIRWIGTKYDSEKIILSLPYDIADLQGILNRFKPYGDFIALEFEERWAHGSCFSHPSTTNDFCAKFTAKGYSTTIGAILRGAEERTYSLTGYHPEMRGLSTDDNSVSVCRYLSS